MRYLTISLFVFSSMVFAQNEDLTTKISSGWGVYGGVQSMQVSGVEDDASDEELGSYSTDRLSSFYIGVWKSTDWKIGSLPVTIGAELGHRGTVSKIDIEFSDGQTLDFKADILITYLDLWASANYAMSDKFNLWIGPMVGIHLDDKIKFFGLDITESEEIDLGFDDNDYGILLGAGYSLTDNMSLNFGVYRGLKDHNPGKFNNLFLDIGYSF
ncbi:MAG TPA: outer membrane beta-barrel protein [Candidatus Marinimicrobia bacterium]|nr:outer membrane beta-barrel protein [Candidatus Neomarinimicrobiota bacterium]